MEEKETKNTVDYSVSPLLDTSFLQARIDVDEEDVKEQLKQAETTGDYMDVLSGLHKLQVRKALQLKRAAATAQKDEPVEEKEDKPVEQSTEPVMEESTEEKEDSFTPFNPIEEEPQPEQEENKEENLFGDLFGSANTGFGGISLDMLEGKNKMEAAEALSAEEFKANNGVLDPNADGGYIDKGDYQKGRQYSKENMKKSDGKTYLTEEDGLFDPENADQSQVVLSSSESSSKTSSINTEKDFQSPFEKSEEQPVKYKAKKKPADKYYGETDGKGIAWMAYILFFIPMLFAGKKSFVRHHANQAFVINIFDLLAGAMIALKYVPLEVSSELFDLVVIIAFALGLAIEVILTFVRVAMIILSLFGKTPQLPLLGKVRIFKIN